MEHGGADSHRRQGGEEVGRRSGQGGKRHSLPGVLKIAHIHRHRLGPAHLGHKHHQQTHHIQMPDGIEGQPPGIFGRGISQSPSHKAVGQPCRVMHSRAAAALIRRVSRPHQSMLLRKSDMEPKRPPP